MRRRWTLALACSLALPLAATLLHLPLPGQEVRRFILPEQRTIQVRRPAQMRPAPLPPIPAPPTITDPQDELPPWNLSLDEAIRVSLANADVIRILTGTTAVSSGSTIYDPAINNSQIDVNRAPFDPRVTSNNQFFRTEPPQAVLVNPGPPAQVEFQTSPTRGFTSNTGVTKQFITGATAGVGVNVNRADTRIPGFPAPLLNPQTQTNTELSLTQPLLQGAGAPANLAPILIARLDTERSYFQLKDSVQDLIRGTIEAYWNLSFARVDAWSRRQQVAQSLEALERAEARVLVGIADESETAQARVSYEQFRANAIGAEANVLVREAALRNIMGIPPSDPRRLLPSTEPSKRRLRPDWDALLSLASEYRPDLIELKLILEADEQRLILARNTALPSLDLTGLYRWNGLEGRTPDQQLVRSPDGAFTDWQYGVNFSVPLGLRAERANLRQQQLLLLRDRANLDQAIHAASHELAANLRNIEQAYEQYLAFQRTREAAYVNLQQKVAANQAGQPVLFLNVLQAITDWGNAVSNEMQALVSYNTLLANLERATGTILETHGVRFVEERYGSIGPLGRLAAPRPYPRALLPGPNADLPRATGNEAYEFPTEVIPLPPVELIPKRRSNAPEPLPGAPPRSSPESLPLPPAASAPAPKSGPPSTTLRIRR